MAGLAVLETRVLYPERAIKKPSASDGSRFHVGLIPAASEPPVVYHLAILGADLTSARRL